MTHSFPTRRSSDLDGMTGLEQWGRVRAEALGSPPRRHVNEDQRKKGERSEEHTSELQSLMRNSYAVFCLKKKMTTPPNNHNEIPYQLESDTQPKKININTNN